jgi:hypothetical protein
MCIDNNSFKFNTLKYIQYDSSIIPYTEGIYKWVYWPNIENFIHNEDEYWKMLCLFSTKRLAEFSNFSDYKFEITVIESSFQRLNYKNIEPFGLSINKSECLKSYIRCDENRRKFNDFLKSVVFSRPFYVGKANNLQNRIKDHSNGNSKILKYIRDQEISNEEIWVGTYELNNLSHSTESENINDVFEEILQKIVKPGLSQRPG